ncbi:MAG: transcription-repair coupling factor [bacterium]
MSDALRDSIRSGVARIPNWRDLVERVARGGAVRLAGLTGSSRGLVSGALAEAAERGALFVAPDHEALDALEHDLGLILGAERVATFPNLETLPFEEKSAHPVTVAARMNTLLRLARGERLAVVTTTRGLLQRVLPPEALAEASVTLRATDPFEPREVAELLIALGFDRFPVVEEPGTMSLRGGIVDIFPHGREYPVRIEFGDDGVDSIREFDPRTQRSRGTIDEAVIAPQTEIPLTAPTRARAAECPLPGLLGENVRRGSFFDGIENLAPHYFPRLATVLDYIAPDVVIVRPEWSDLEPHEVHLFEEAERFRDARIAADAEAEAALPAPGALFASLREITDAVRTRPSIEIAPKRASHADAGAAQSDGVFTATFQSTPQPAYAGSIKLLRDDIARLGADHELFLLCDNVGQADRLRELLDAYAGAVTIAVGALHEGFSLREAGLVIFTDHELFNRYRRKRRYPRYRGAGPVEDFRALREGDVVVHVTHGIGRFVRLESIEVEGRRHDCVLVAYQGGDKLFVPTDQLDLLEKYVGKDGEPPKLDRIGGKEWARTKARTKKAIKEMADELIALYAARQSRPGHPFGPDTHWQQEIESSFLYEETPDQLRAITEVKADLEKERPMDRLVCGDVGYGKTEVAVRAAFKVVMEGKQAAILVPTTLLAEQHLNTFRERVADFPVKVEMLSRFRTAAQQKQIVQLLAAGEIDIVIGTHRLLQKDIAFKDLGLVVIDEEQRFGVAHKERLKKFRRLVDVLTLTATPIPRTMHMALLGVRDMSVIDTPPPGRLPIETEVIEWNDEVIAGAILREIDRGGQVFVVHNRIETINTVAAHIHKIVPEVRCATAHGQMGERALENIMLEFLDRKYDVLISTMIIESGLDIPSVNTIIVNRADEMGLAQLYQLRGRVGRTNVNAYAYLVTPPKRALTEVAMKRLNALQDFTELGSGFKIAMKDLEIRGAGNLLGPEQHGYVAAVGFDLYCRLLEEAVREIRGEPEHDTIAARIEADVDAFIPESLIEESEQRLDFYKRLAKTTTEEEVASLEAELRDRYGVCPAVTQNLFALRSLRLAAEKASVELVRLREGRARIQVAASREVARDAIGRVVAASAAPVEFLAGDGRSLRVDLSRFAGETRLSEIHRLLQALAPADRM